MRKLTLSLLISSISLISFSQSKNVQNAYNEFRKEKNNVKTNISEAKYFIDLAHKNETTSNDPKMWNYRAQIYLEIINNHPNMDENAVFEATEAHIRCLDKNKKGKIIVRKWTREEDVVNGLVQCGYKLFNSGTDDYNNKEYNKAIKKYEEIFRIIPFDTDNLLKRGNIVPEAIYKNLFLTALQLDNEELQINYLQKSIDLNTNDPMVYYNMSLVYSKKNELQNALKYTKKGLEQFPSEISLINLEIDLLMKMGSSTEDIITKLSEAIDLDNSNEILYIIRSQMYSKIENIDAAESDLIEALEINPESSTANNNLAGLYLDLSVQVDNELKEYRGSNRAKINSFEEEILSLQKKALPYLIKYVDLNILEAEKGETSYDISSLDALAKIYYNLDMIEENSKIRDLIKTISN